MLITIIHNLSAASKVTQQEVSELRKVWIQVPFGFSKIQQVFALYQFWLSDRNKSESSWFIEITALLKKMIKIMIQTEMRSQHLQVQVCSYFSCSTWRVLHSSTRLCSGDKDKQHEQWFILQFPLKPLVGQIESYGVPTSAHRPVRKTLL